MPTPAAQMPTLQCVKMFVGFEHEGLDKKSSMILMIILHSNKMGVVKIDFYNCELAKTIQNSTFNYYNLWYLTD